MDISGRYRYRRWRQWKQRIGWISIFAGLCALLLWGSFWIPYFRIQTITIEGKVSESQVKNAINQYLSSYNTLFLPNNHILLVSPQKIESLLRVQELGIARAERHIPHTLHISFPERIPFALVCRADVRCYYLNTEGLLFSEAPEFSNAPLLLITTNPSFPHAFETLTLGDYLADIATLNYLVTMTEYFSKEGIEIIAIETQQISETNLPFHFQEIKIYTSEDWHLFVNTNRLAESVFRDFKLLLDQKIKTRANLSSVDLRFENKAFYKLK